MRIGKALTLTAVLLTPANLGYAYNVQALLGKCDAALDDEINLDAVFCMGVVEGVTTIARHNCESKLHGWNPYHRFTSEADATNGAIMQTFVNWARANPSQWDIPAAVGMAVALSKAFPCTNE